MMKDMGRPPIMIKWLRRVCSFWNKLAAMGEHCAMYRMVVEGMAYAHSWARQIASAMQSFGYNVCDMFDAQSQNLRQIDVEHAVGQALDRWSHTAWMPYRNALRIATEIHQQNPQGGVVRSVPDDIREGFKVLKSLLWFSKHDACPQRPHDTLSHWCTMVHKWTHVRVIAKFRLGMHWLRTETEHNIPRSTRICTICHLSDREDELHVLVCPAYMHLHHKFPLVFGDQIYRDLARAYSQRSSHIDGLMIEIMNQSGHAYWAQLADFLIQAQFVRRACIDR